MTALQLMPTVVGGRQRYFRTPASSSTGSHGRYKASSTDFIGSFYAVLRRWRSETAFLSDPEKITDNQSYKALVANAETVAPLIISELRASPSRLVWVLEDAFNERPYSPDQVGNIAAMTDAWIAWAERNGRSL